MRTSAPSGSLVSPCGKPQDSRSRRPERPRPSTARARATRRAPTRPTATAGPCTAVVWSPLPAPDPLQIHEASLAPARGKERVDRRSGNDARLPDLDDLIQRPRENVRRDSSRAAVHSCSKAGTHAPHGFRLEFEADDTVLNGRAARVWQVRLLLCALHCQRTGMQVPQLEIESRPDWMAMRHAGCAPSCAPGRRRDPIPRPVMAAPSCLGSSLRCRDHGGVTTL